MVSVVVGAGSRGSGSERRCGASGVRFSVLSVDDVKAGLSRREPENGAAEPGRDLLETDVLEVTEAARAKNRGNASRLEAAGPTFTNSLELSRPGRHCFLQLF